MTFAVGELVRMNWYLVMATGCFGAAMATFGLHFFTSRLEDRKDRFGVPLSQRFSFLTFNGIAVVAVSAIIAILKVFA